jgi:hypothetical protein
MSGMRDSRKTLQTLSGDLFCMRGISILLVVVVHVLGVDASHGVRKLFAPNRVDLQAVVEFIHSFNMAVMLIGSGVAVAAFGRADLSLSDFLRKKVNKLLIPLLVWSPVLFLLQQLQRGGAQGPEGWANLIRLLPTAWIPPYAIFWFLHALMGCTLLAWVFRKFAAPVLGRWSELAYFVLALLLYFAESLWRARTGSSPGGYLELILYWNRFFALGLLVHPWLGSVRQALARRTVAAQALLPVGFFSLLLLVYTVLPQEQYAVVRLINGPLGFCMLFSLAVFLGNGAARWGAWWREGWSRLATVGSLSMVLYLFHLYFTSGMRVVLERWHPGTSLAVHLVLGTLAGSVGPWLLFQVFKGSPLFHWSIGHPAPVPRERVQAEQPHEGLAPIPGAR